MPPRRPPRGRTPPVPEEAPPAENVNIADFMRQFVQACAQQATQPVQPERQGERQVEDRMLDRFLRYNPPKFYGEPDDLKAEAWISEIEQIFQVARIDDLDRVEFSIFLLKGPAQDWWKLVKQGWQVTGEPVTWDRFLREFRNKYIPLVVRDRREQEFMELVQGNATVAKYEARFARLITYAPHIGSDERRRTRRFIHGLKYEIRYALMASSIGEYTEAVARAMEVESELREMQHVTSPVVSMDRSVGSKRPMVSPRQSDEKRPFTPSRQYLDKRPRSPGTRPTNNRTVAFRSTGDRKRPCHFCGLPGHVELNCWRKHGRCLQCGSNQHLARDCPKVPPQQRSVAQSGGTQRTGRVGRPIVHARAYALGGEEGRMDPSSVVEGTLSILGIPIRALYDPGATHSLIAHDIAVKTSVPVECLNYVFEISSPLRFYFAIL